MTAEQLIEFFKMEPLPGEGGYYVETYRASEKIPAESLDKRYGGERNHSTAILYLLTADTCSRLHRVKSDEVFHFYFGGAVTMLQLSSNGRGKVLTLGCDISGGQVVQAVVPRGVWQGCFLNPGGEFALMGCSVSPGFEFEDFETGDRKELLADHSKYQDLICKLTEEV